MKLYYKAISKEGKKINGVLEAKDKNDAAVYLRSKGYSPISIDTKSGLDIAQFLPFLKKSGSGSDVVFFTRQLSSMLVSGLTLLQALAIFKEQVQSPIMKEVVGGIVTEIQEGKSFSLAITRYPDLFSSVYVSSIKAGETSGLLDKVLLRLADNLEKQQKLKSTVKSALMYPAIVITGMILVVTVMMVFVIPQIAVLYQNLNIPLPLPTQIIIGMSNFTVNFWPLVIGFIVLFMFFFKRWHSTPVGRMVVDTWLLRMPIFGKIIKGTTLTEFTRTFGLLIGSGALVVEALKEASDVSANVLYKNAILGIAKLVEKGVTIGDAMSTFELFPPILVQMAKIGEQTGKLDESLLKVSEYFEGEVDIAVKNLTTAMEPIILIVLGAGVAFLIISIITPIYNLTSSIQ